MDEDPRNQKIAWLAVILFVLLMLGLLIYAGISGDLLS